VRRRKIEYIEHWECSIYPIFQPAVPKCRPSYVYTYPNSTIFDSDGPMCRLRAIQLINSVTYAERDCWESNHDEPHQRGALLQCRIWALFKPSDSNALYCRRINEHQKYRVHYWLSQMWMILYSGKRAMEIHWKASDCNLIILALPEINSV
jgi:hypothetical protein